MSDSKKRLSSVTALLNKTSNVRPAVETALKDNPQPAERPPITMPGQLSAFVMEQQGYLEEIESLKRRLAEAEVGASSEIDIELLDEVPGRKRKLTKEEWDQLHANLAVNKLNHPIVIRPKDNGRYDIISGHNRTASFRLHGRKTIPYVLQNSDEDTAKLNAFFSNLFQTTLSDYEKYLGFKMMMELQPELELKDLAKQSGVSQSQISRVMAFEKLPEEVTSILYQSPYLIGANAAADLVKAADNGKVEKVIEAVQKLASGELQEQHLAVKYANTATAAAPETKVIEQEKFKVGRSVYCNFRRVKNSIRLDFSSEEEAAEVDAAIREVIARRAQAKNQ